MFFTLSLLRHAIMASLQQVVEQLALLAAKGTNGTSGAGATLQTSAQRGPLDFVTSSFQMLFSASALRDWAILLVIGSLFETARRLLSSLWYALINAFFITAVFDEEDASFRTYLVVTTRSRVLTSFDRVDHALVVQAAFMECVMSSKM